MRLAVIAAVALGPILSLGAASATTGTAGLRGFVLRDALVCRTDSCEEPAGGILLRFSRAGRTVATVKTTTGGGYAVRLSAGSYRVTVARQVGTGLRPRVVRVPLRRIARVDFHLDAGTQ